MRTRLLMLSLCLALVAAPLAAQSFTPTTPTIPVEEIHTGMRGTGLTIFSGDKPEEFGVEVLGVLRNMAGPQSSIILVRLHGAHVEYYGAAGGMSGSPVYFDGKLAGAVAYRFGEFNKEAIAGLTPIADMLSAAAAEPERRQASLASLLANPAPVAVGAASNAPTPLDTPLALSGFSSDALRRLEPFLAAQGLRAVAGAASSTDAKPQPLVAGGAIGLSLLRGDLDMSAICTITYIDASHLLACGHPVLGVGAVEIPMTNASIVATLPTALSPTKLGVTGAVVGSFVQDRRHAIYGRLDRAPRMIPVRLEIAGRMPRTIRFEAIDTPQMTPTLIVSALLGAITSDDAFSNNDSMRVEGEFKLEGRPALPLRAIYTPNEMGQPSAVGLAMSLYERLLRLYNNVAEAPRLTELSLRVSPIEGRRQMRVVTARAERDSVHPGQTLPIDVTLQPWQGAPIVRRILFRIPESAPLGAARILVGDGAQLDRLRLASLAASTANLDQTLRTLASEHANDRLYLSLTVPSHQVVAAGESLGSLPASLANVYAPQRASREAIVLNDSSIAEQSEPMEAQISGSIQVPVVIE